MKNCWEIKNCLAKDNGKCQNLLAAKVCWERKKGCLCLADKLLKCPDCEIYSLHLQELNSYLERARQFDPDATHRLIEHYQKYVFQIAKKFFLPGQEPEDLIQEGMLGLFKGIMRFDPAFSDSFENFLSLSIRNQMLTAVRNATQRKVQMLTRAIPLDPLCGEESNNLGTDELFEDEIIASLSINQLIIQLMEKLSPVEKEVLNARIQGKNYQKTQAELSLTRRQIENALYRAKQKFMQEYQKIESSS